MKKGIDVSEWNSGLDYTTLSRNIDFVIIREGYRQKEDALFRTHVAGFRALKVPIIGVYHFIYATDNQAVKKEAESCIKHVQAAGLPKSTRIWCDFEYDTVKKAKAQGVTLGKAECNLFSRTFCDTVAAAGYPTGIYTNLDYYKNWYTKETLDRYPVWLADCEGEPDYPCMIQQYTSKGKLPGHTQLFDMDYLVKEEVNEEMGITANDAINVFRGWLGKNEYDNSHRAIIDIYNSHKPLARGYKVKYTDQWCDTAVSAVFISLGATDIIGGTECGVEEHVKLFKKAGIWIEDGSITPKAGDLIIFNWDDTTQPNDGYSDHIGMVEKVTDNTITTIEGNYRDSVARRTLKVGTGYIRGYARPKYAEKKPDEKPQGGLNKTPKYVASVTASRLNVRTWAGTSYPNLKSYPYLDYGNLVDVCDVVKASDGSDWDYIRIAGQYYGFASAKYLKRV